MERLKYDSILAPDKLPSIKKTDTDAIIDEIIKSGAKNTMTWRPILVDNYKVADLEDEFVKMESTRKQAICQLDSNNFIIITQAVFVYNIRIFVSSNKISNITN